MLLLVRCALLACRPVRLLIAARDLLPELSHRRLRRRSSRARATWLNHRRALLAVLPRRLATGECESKTLGSGDAYPSVRSTGAAARARPGRKFRIPAIGLDPLRRRFPGRRMSDTWRENGKVLGRLRSTSMTSRSGYSDPSPQRDREERPARLHSLVARRNEDELPTGVWRVVWADWISG